MPQPWHNPTLQHLRTLQKSRQKGRVYGVACAHSTASKLICSRGVEAVFLAQDYVNLFFSP